MLTVDLVVDHCPAASAPIFVYFQAPNAQESLVFGHRAHSVAGAVIDRMPHLSFFRRYVAARHCHSDRIYCLLCGFQYLCLEGHWHCSGDQ